jgi:hypothetical protein
VSDLGDIRAIEPLTRASLVYLATPYTRYPHGVGQAFRDAAKLAARLWLAGIAVYCPVVHGHPVAVYGGIHPNHHSFWYLFNRPYWDRCDCLLVAMLDGWQQSSGIADEVFYFRAEGKPIYYLDPSTMRVSDAA